MLLYQNRQVVRFGPKAIFCRPLSFSEEKGFECTLKNRLDLDLKQKSFHVCD